MLTAMPEIPSGVRLSSTVLVTSEVAISFLGNDSARVLATPWMIAFMEMVSRDLLKPHLPEGWDSVGTEVSVRHLAPTPIGKTVTFHSELIRVEKRKAHLKIWAIDEDGQTIGEGTHERGLIDVKRFAEKVGAKAQPPNS